MSSTLEQSAALERSAMLKVAWRLVPFLGLAYFVNALDRTNVAIAALTMNKSLGFSAAEYGFGAGAFFWSYVLFQVPSNLMLARIGARRWLTVVIFAWGLASASTALITDVTSFAVVRFLLGVAEAGYFPGVIFFMTRWFPSRHRGRAMGIFFAFSAVAVSTASPISGNILALHGWLGLAGWQWIFLIEAVPALILAVICPFLLRDTPQKAAWLTNDEKAWLAHQLATEQSEAHAARVSMLRTLRDGRMIVMIISYFGIGCGIYANIFFLPLIIKDLGFSNLTVSYMAALPAALGAVGMVLNSRHSDRTGERMLHTAVPMLMAALGLLFTGATVGNAWLEMIGLCVAGVGMSSCLPTFWTLPTTYLGVSAAAAGIALINSLGNISGYVAPQVVGVLRDWTGNYSAPMYVAGGVVLIASALLPFCGVGAAPVRLSHAPVSPSGP
jgi:ACS family tartrate transporter-like MFS transporter